MYIIYTMVEIVNMRKTRHLRAPLCYFLATLILFYILGRGQTLDAIEIGGMSLTLIAFGFWFIARLQIGEILSIDPQATRLIRTGLYAYIRHPIYIFSTLVLIGIVLFLKIPVLMGLPLVWATLSFFRAKREEKVLYEKFGEEYLEYKRTTVL